FVPRMSQIFEPDVLALSDALIRLTILSNVATPGDAPERAALEVYVAGRFRPMIADPATWANPMNVAILGPRRALAERAVAEHPRVSANELARATTALGPFFDTQERIRRNASSLPDAVSHFVDQFELVMTFIALWGVLWAAVLRGGLLFKVCGIAVVTRDGKPASRLRTLWRGLVAWSLALAPPAWWLIHGAGFAARLPLRASTLAPF